MFHRVLRNRCISIIINRNSGIGMIHSEEGIGTMNRVIGSGVY
jgi:hypothetical protein